MLSVVVLALLVFSGASGEDLSAQEHLEYFRQLIELGDDQLAKNHQDFVAVGEVSLPLGVLRDFIAGNFSSLRLVGPDEFQYINRTEADGVVVFYFTLRLGLDVKADAILSYAGYDTPMALHGGQNEFEVTGTLTVNTNRNGYKCSASLEKGSIIETGTYRVTALNPGFYFIATFVKYISQLVLNYLIPCFNKLGLLKDTTDYLVRAVSSSPAFTTFACSAF